jgi:hypothetical protein
MRTGQDGFGGADRQQIGLGLHRQRELGLARVVLLDDAVDAAQLFGKVRQAIDEGGP